MKSAVESRHRGFSIAVVLVVLVFGMALMGVAFSMFNSFTHRSIALMQETEELNLMNTAIERGKMELSRMIDEFPSMPMAVFKAGGTTIQGRDDLLIGTTSGGTTPFREVETAKAGGEDVQVTLEVFDIRYEESNMDAGLRNDEARRAALPPAMEYTSGGMGDLITVGSVAASNAITDLDSYEGMSDSSGINRVGAGDVGFYLIRATVEREKFPNRVTEVVLARKKG